MTSSDVVTYIRRRLNIKKVGHTGTLDPLNLYCGKIEGDDDKVFHLIGDEQEILDKIKRLDVEIEYLSVKEMDLKEAILEVMNN